MRVRYSLRGMFALLAALGILLAAYANARRRVRDEADLSDDLSAANVWYAVTIQNEKMGPGTLSLMLGLAPPDSRIYHATFYMCEDDGRLRALLPRLPKLPRLGMLTLNYTIRPDGTVPDSPEPAFAKKNLTPRANAWQATAFWR